MERIIPTYRVAGQATRFFSFSAWLNSVPGPGAKTCRRCSPAAPALLAACFMGAQKLDHADEVVEPPKPPKSPDSPEPGETSFRDETWRALNRPPPAAKQAEFFWCVTPAFPAAPGVRRFRRLPL